MSLKRIKVKVNETVSAKKSDIPVTHVEGDICKKLNAVKAQIKELEAQHAELEPEFKSRAAVPFYSYNLQNPTNPVASINLVDETGAITRYTSKNQYKQADAEVVSAAFEELDKDVNVYVQEVCKVSFNSKVFIDENGNFSTARYNAYKKAIDKVSAELGVESPLTGKTVVEPKPNFHENRYVEFPTIEAQVKILEVLPNTISIAAVVE